MLTLISIRNPSHEIDRMIKDAISCSCPIVFDSSHEGEFEESYAFQRVLEVHRQYDIPVTALTINYPITNKLRKTYNSINFVAWPTFWFLRTYVTMGLQDTSAIKCNNDNELCLIDNNVNTSITDYNKLFISMNLRVKVHRCMMMDYLSKYNLIARGNIAWHNLDYNNQDVGDGDGYGFKYKYWKSKPMYLDQNTKYNFDFNQELLPREYAKTFMQIVPETDYTYFVITEKVVVPVFYNKPFLVVGCQHYHRYLQELGFELYDEVFEYSFDTEPDIENRCEGIAQNIMRLSSANSFELNALYQQLLPKIRYNRQLAVKYATDPTTWPAIVHTVIQESPKQNIANSITIVNMLNDSNLFKFQ